MSVLSRKAMLVNLKISSWSGRKYDRAASRIVTDAMSADTSSGRFNKALIPVDSDSYKAITKASSKARTYHYDSTLPWDCAGAAILPAIKYMDYTSEMRKFRGEYDSAVAKFLLEYPSLKQRAQGTLGAMFHDSDYPSPEDLATRYKFDISIMPIPESGDFRVELGETAEADIKKDIEASVTDNFAAANRSLYERLKKVTTAMASRLSDPDATFRNSLVQNVQDLCILIPELNVTEDPELEKLAATIKTELADHNPEVLRRDKTVRADVAAKAVQINSMLNAYTGG